MFSRGNCSPAERSIFQFFFLSSFLLQFDFYVKIWYNIGYIIERTNNMYKKICSMLKNYIKGENHWEYSLSISLFIVGALLFAFTTIKNDIYLIMLSSCMFFIGICALPNFKSSYIDAFAKGTLCFSLSSIGIILDVVIIRNIIKCIMNSQIVYFYYYFFAIILTFLLARYYIDVSHRAITTITKEIHEKSSVFKKVWKHILSSIGFLISLVSLINSIITLIS